MNKRTVHFRISGRKAMSQSFCSCTKMKKNIFVMEYCCLNHIITTDPFLLSWIGDTFTNSQVILNVWWKSCIDVLQMDGEISCLCTSISLPVLFIQHNTEFRILNLELKHLYESNIFWKRIPCQSHLLAY